MGCGRVSHPLFLYGQGYRRPEGIFNPKGNRTPQLYLLETDARHFDCIKRMAVVVDPAPEFLCGCTILPRQMNPGLPPTLPWRDFRSNGSSLTGSDLRQVATFVVDRLLHDAETVTLEGDIRGGGRRRSECRHSDETLRHIFRNARAARRTGNGHGAGGRWPAAKAVASSRKNSSV